MSNQQDIQKAIQLYQNGSIEQAKKKLAHYISSFPNDVNANLLAAAIGAEEKDFSTVVEKCKKVLTVEPDNINAIYNIAVANDKLRNYQDVLIYSPQVLQKDPNNVPILLLYIGALYILGKYENCITFIESIPDMLVLSNPSISIKLAECNMAFSNFEPALKIFRDNIAANVNVAECFHNIGIIMDRQDNIDNAIQAYQSAISVSPNALPSNYNLAFVLYKKGRNSDALLCMHKCFEIEDSHKVRQAFVQILSTAKVEQVDPVTEKYLLEIMVDKDTDGRVLSELVIELLKHRFTTINELFLKANEDDYTGFLDILMPVITEVSTNTMLRIYFANLQIADYKFEIFARMLRRSLLLNYSHVTDVSQSIIELCASIAIRCYIDGYVFTVNNAEKDLLSKLIDDFYKDKNSINNSCVAFIAMYVSMYELYKKNVFTINSAKNRGLVAEFIKLQLEDNVVEEELYSTIECDIEIKDETSLVVQQQYEGNPYPVWQRLNIRQQESVNQIIQRVTSFSDKTEFSDELPSILIAGCGTGSHAIQTAMRIKHESLTAIDLSRRSLAFAKRKAIEYGFEYINFKHLDILHVSSLDKKYDLIESVGVLHHMQEPLKGLHCLVDILEPGGLMNIGLYSKLGRRYIIKAKNIYDDAEKHVSDDEIRQLRTVLMSSADDELVKNVAGFNDFYSLHDCRDLIFHENENNYDIEELVILIKEVGLDFVGFDINDPLLISQFRKMYPDKNAQSVLKNWQAYEEKYPDAFSSMYVFWCRKPA